MNNGYLYLPQPHPEADNRINAQPTFSKFPVLLMRHNIYGEQFKRQPFYCFMPAEPIDLFMLVLVNPVVDGNALHHGTVDRLMQQAWKRLPVVREHNGNNRHSFMRLSRTNGLFLEDDNNLPQEFGEIPERVRMATAVASIAFADMQSS